MIPSSLITYFLVALISAIPLYFAVLFLGGNVTLLKAALVNILCGVILSFIHQYFGVTIGILSLFITIIVYKIMFDLGWIRGFLVFLLEGVFVLLLIKGLALSGISKYFQVQ